MALAPSFWRGCVVYRTKRDPGELDREQSPGLLVLHKKRLSADGIASLCPLDTATGSGYILINQLIKSNRLTMGIPAISHSDHVCAPAQWNVDGSGSGLTSHCYTSTQDVLQGTMEKRSPA